MSEHVKIVLTGSCGTGKTSIIKKLIYKTFDLGYVSTEGGTCGKHKFVYPEFNGKELIMDIWDTAGQEKYKALTKIFYKDSEIVILVYDITNKKSFKELKNYWIPQLKEAGIDGIIKGLAANKSDLFGHEEISEQEGMEFAKEINATFKLTSAFSNNGIEDLFKEIGLRYLKNKYSNKAGNNDTKSNERANNGKIQIDKASKKKNGKKKSDCC